MSAVAGLKHLGRAAFGLANARRIRRRSLREARRGLAAAAAARRVDARRFRVQARDYAGDVLGGPVHAPWLELYATLQGRFAEGWIPPTYYVERALGRVNGTAHHIARYRTLNAKLFGPGYFPDAGYVVGGRLLDEGYRPLSPDRLAGAETLVFKPDHSAFGTGVRSVEPGGLSARDLSSIGNGVFQRRVIPHPAFDIFGTPSLPTLRLCTVIEPSGAISVRSAYLKLGRAGEAHIRSASQVRVPVDLTRGTLAAEGALSTWAPVMAHPDTGTRFAGHALPAFDTCKAVAVALHGKMPFARFLCWDMAVDRAGAVAVLEWEGGVVSFAEAMQGPCFADLHWDREPADGR